MGSTYFLPATGVANANGKNLIAIYNGNGSGKTVRIWRVFVSNAQTNTITGGVAIARAGRFYTAYSGGTGLTPVSMDPTNPSFPSQIVSATGPTGITITDIVRQLAFFMDEFSVADASSDILNVIPGLSVYLDFGYLDENLEPFMLAEGEGFAIQHAGAAYPNNYTLGTFDIYVEFDLV